MFRNVRCGVFPSANQSTPRLFESSIRLTYPKPGSSSERCDDTLASSLMIKTFLRSIAVHLPGAYMRQLKVLIQLLVWRSRPTRPIAEGPHLLAVLLLMLFTASFFRHRPANGIWSQRRSPIAPTLLRSTRFSLSAPWAFCLVFLRVFYFSTSGQLKSCINAKESISIPIAG